MGEKPEKISRLQTASEAVQGQGKYQLEQRIQESRLLPRDVNPDQVVSAVLCGLTYHLSQGEALDLLNTLPEDIRSFARACTLHREEHPFAFDRDQFNRIIAEHLKVDSESAESLARIVFSCIKQWVPSEEIKDVESQLSKDLKALWRAA